MRPGERDLRKDAAQLAAARVVLYEYGNLALAANLKIVEDYLLRRHASPEGAKVQPTKSWRATLKKPPSPTTKE